MAFGGQLVTFWHVTDIHLDLNYSQFGDINFYCHDNPPYNQILPKFGFSSDVYCDTPYALAESAVRAMRDINSQPDFILYTGDSAPHLDDSDTNTNNVITTITNVTNLFYAYFPDTKFYSVLGNHDYWPGDQLPTTTNRIYQTVAQLWGKYLSSEAAFNLSQHGYYRQELDVPANTILLGLNTNLYYKYDRVTRGLQDPAGQYAFLESSLIAARANGKKVMVISHIPRGSDWVFNNTMADRLVVLLNNYGDIIIGSHFGHDHDDEIFLVRNVANDEFVSFLLVAPAVTTILGYGSNPGIRQISIDSDTGDIRVLKQYYLNLTDANLTGNDTWQLQYTINVPEGKTFLQYIANYYQLLKSQGKASLSDYYFS